MTCSLWVLHDMELLCRLHVRLGFSFGQIFYLHIVLLYYDYLSVVLILSIVFPDSCWASVRLLLFFRWRRQSSRRITVAWRARWARYVKLKREHIEMMLTGQFTVEWTDQDNRWTGMLFKFKTMSFHRWNVYCLWLTSCSFVKQASFIALSPIHCTGRKWLQL